MLFDMSINNKNVSKHDHKAYLGLNIVWCSEIEAFIMIEVANQKV